MCLGTVFRSGIDPDRCLAAIEEAHDLGCNFLDAANIYQEGASEEIVGKAIKGRRDKFIVTTKVGSPHEDDPASGGLSRKAIHHEVEQSLRRLDTDFIDLYLCHFPDRDTPIAETVGAMDDLVREGKVRFPGVSNFSVHQLTEALQEAERTNAAPPVCNQVKYNLLERGIEDDVIPFCGERKVAVTLFATTYIGLLSGRYRRGRPPPEGTSWHRGPYNYKAAMTPEVDCVIEALIDVGRECGRTPSQVAMAWCLARPEVTAVITGSDSAERVASNFQAGDFELTTEDRARLDEVSAGMRLEIRKDAPDGYRSQ